MEKDATTNDVVSGRMELKEEYFTRDQGAKILSRWGPEVHLSEVGVDAKVTEPILVSHRNDQSHSHV